MLIANGATQQLYVSDFHRQNSRLQTAMAKLSSGQRMIVPGEAPADLGISERFRAQIRNSEEAGRVIQNAVNMFTTSDGWLQVVNDILGRMSELSIAASDGSKNQDDRQNLDLEFQQLKDEIARISESGKYNGMQVNGRTGVAVWDTVDNTVTYSQFDGTEVRDIEINMNTGSSSSNGIEYMFEDTAGNIGEFMFTADGKNLLYVNQATSANHTVSNKYIMKLELESNTLSSLQIGAGASVGGLSANDQQTFRLDESGRVWVSTATDADTATGDAGFQIQLLDVQGLSLDSGGAAATNSWAGAGTTASGMADFTVHENFLYYFRQGVTNTNNYEYVKQSMFDTNDVQVLISDITSVGMNDPTNTDGADLFSISQDGQYIAYRDLDADVGAATSASLVVVNAFTQKSASMIIGTETTAGNDAHLHMTDLDFDANNNLFWTATGSNNVENAIRRATIVGDREPEITNVLAIRDENMGHFGSNNTTTAGNGGGLSVRGGTPAANMLFQVGPDSGMLLEVETADVSIVKLGLSTSDVLSIETAQKAIKSVAKAIDKVSNQRAFIGSEVSRLNFTYSANNTYGDNIEQAESRIRDVDFAQETAELSAAQVLSQASASILSQANAQRAVVLQLLQG